MSYHKKISLIKSTLRLIGYLLLLVQPTWAIGVLVLSEVLGILEEAKEK